jgi:phosphoglycolate phosphatase-like HAD superfamily hydrolase
MYTRDHLIALKPRHDSFVGIDSDGCVFPTMEIKQKQCFHALIISQWRLERIGPYVREAAEFVNLYSIHRGQNRFVSLLKVFELLRERPEVQPAGVTLPDTRPLRAFIASGRPLSNAELERRVAETRDPELAVLLEWTLAVNDQIAAKVKGIPPFEGVVESLEVIRRHSDAICVSQTPTEAIVREWEENHLLGYVSAIAGQELGTKAEHLTLAAKGKYPDHRILMIGDAPGDLNAARAVNAHFFPINPGHEEESWAIFSREAYTRFRDGTYGGEYEAGLVTHFESLLPETPPWKRTQ